MVFFQVTCNVEPPFCFHRAEKIMNLEHYILMAHKKGCNEKLHCITFAGNGVCRTLTRMHNCSI